MAQVFHQFSGDAFRCFKNSGLSIETLDIDLRTWTFELVRFYLGFEQAAFTNNFKLTYLLDIFSINFVFCDVYKS